MKEAIFLMVPRPDNIDPVKKIDEFPLDLLKQNSRLKYCNRI